MKQAASSSWSKGQQEGRDRLVASLDLLHDVITEGRISGGMHPNLVAEVFKVIWANHLA